MSPSPFHRCLFVLAMLAGSGECGAARIGELLVKEGKAGMPCFTIPEAEEARSGTPDFHSIMVTELGGRAALWRMEMPAQRTFPVTVRMCIPYAGRVPVLPQTPAAPLTPGTVYEVAINARSARSPAAPRDYRARFCLILSNGVLRVKNIDVATARQRAVCE